MSRTKGIGLSRVAEAAGVSIATVSNVVNRPEMVSESTQARVREAMLALDFVPNRAAATLRQGSNRLIGLVVPEIVNPFYAAVAEAAGRAASLRGYALALCVTHDDAEVEMRHFEMLAEQRAAGAILLPMFADSERLKQLRMVGTHLVLIDRRFDDGNGCSVVMDDIEGGRLATRHLLASESDDRITLVNGPDSVQQCRDRRTGVLKALQDAGLPSTAMTEHVAATMTLDEGLAIGQLLPADHRLRIFCTNDQLAAGVIRGLRDRGIRIPEQARVVGYGDLDLATGGDVDIASIAQPMSTMGELAVDMVLNEIADVGQHTHTVTVLQPTLVARASAP